MNETEPSKDSKRIPPMEESASLPPVDSSILRRAFSRRNLLVGTATALVGERFVQGGYDSISRFLYKKFGEKNYDQPLARVIENLKQIHPQIDQWIDSDEWAKGIAEACSKNKIEPTLENLGIVLTLVSHESGFRTSARVVDTWASPVESVVKATGLVQPRTSGPMELSNKFIMADENVSYEQAVKMLQTIKGGLFYGVKHLKGLQENYSKKPDKHEVVLQCIFADYNAGAFASRNAGLQRVINELANSQLREDGLLLRPKNSNNKLTESLTQKAVLELFGKFNINFAKSDVERDLSLQLSSDLEKTATWREIQKLYKRIIPLVPANRPVLGVVGVAKKTITGIDNSRDYSVARMREFQTIIELASQEIK